MDDRKHCKASKILRFKARRERPARPSAEGLTCSGYSATAGRKHGPSSTVVIILAKFHGKKISQGQSKEFRYSLGGK